MLGTLFPLVLLVILSLTLGSFLTYVHWSILCWRLRKGCLQISRVVSVPLTSLVTTPWMLIPISNLSFDAQPHFFDRGKLQGFNWVLSLCLLPHLWPLQKVFPSWPLQSTLNLVQLTTCTVTTVTSQDWQAPLNFSLHPVTLFTCPNLPGPPQPLPHLLRLRAKSDPWLTWSLRSSPSPPPASTANTSPHSLCSPTRASCLWGNTVRPWPWTCCFQCLELSDSGKHKLPSDLCSPAMSSERPPETPLSKTALSSIAHWPLACFIFLHSPYCFHFILLDLGLCLCSFSN